MERLYRLLAWKVIPFRLRYWVVIRAMADATTGQWANEEAPAVSAVDVLKRMS